MILVLHQGAIGDFLLTLSVIQAVRDAGESRVVVIASATSAHLAAGRSAVDEWHSPEYVSLHALFGENCVLAPEFEELLGQAELVLSFLGDTASTLHRRLSSESTARIISVDPRPTVETLSAGRHITAQWTEDIKRQGLEFGEPQAPCIDWPRAARPAESDHPHIIIHPGSGGRSKCWPVGNFIALVDALHELERPPEVAWMLGPAECEDGDDRFQPIRERCSDGREMLIVEPDLAAAADHLAAASLYIGNDGGMTHLAAALGVPTLAVFVSTDPRVWRPLGYHVRTVSL